jgi:polyisoprenoid-binding protein YceI
MKRRYLAIIAVIAAIIGIAAGLFAYDYFYGLGDVDETPPEAPTLEAAADTQVVYRIDPEQSEVRYRVNELFLRENLPASPVGVTKGIAGDILIDFDNPASSQVGTIVINVEQFTSDRDLRDRAIRRDYLESATYPEATFVPNELIGFPENPVEGEAYTFQVAGDLTVKETTAPETFDLTVTLEGDTLTGSASTVILMSTYDVGPITVAGFVETEDEVTLEFDFVAVRVADETLTENPTTLEETATPSE